MANDFNINSNNPKGFIRSFYTALVARDAEAIMWHYDTSPNTYIISEKPAFKTPGTGFFSGGWEAYLSSDWELRSIFWTEGPFEDRMGEMAWLAGGLQLEMGMHKHTYEQMFKATFILRQRKQHWKIVHEHVSGLPGFPFVSET